MVALRRGVVVCACLTGLLLGMSGIVQAQQPTERELKLEKLVNELLQRVEELEKQAVKSGSNNVTEATDPKAVKTSLNNGLVFETVDKEFTMKIGGRVQNDWFAGSIDDGDFPDGTRFRRIWLKTMGTVFGDYDYKVQYDLAGDGIGKWKDIWIDYKGLDFTKIRVGLFKEPFSMEELMLNRDLSFLERAAPNTLVPSRNTGIMFHNSILDNRMTWEAGAFKISNNFGDGDEDDAQNGDWDLTARVTGLPWYEDGGRRLLHLGAAYNHRDWDDEPLRYRARGSYSRGDRLVDTGTYNVDKIDSFGAEAGLVYGPASLMSEYVHSEVDATNTGSDGYDSFYVQASYFLTGEHRPYKGGMWTRVKPKTDFSLKDGGWGAWEAAARYSYMDLDDTPVAGADGGEMNDITLGLNWYLNPSMRLMWNYVHSETDDSAIDDRDADIVQMRLQLDF